MKNKPIILVNGEPNSVFLEIFFKCLKYRKYKSPLILISSLELLKIHMKKCKFKKKIQLVSYKDINKLELNNKCINLIDVQLKSIKNSKNITNKSNSFIKNSFEIAQKIIKLGFTQKLINGPISKTSFLNKKYLGITEFLAKRSNTKKFAMLIYNKNLAVCPITTHLPIKNVSKSITKNIISEKISLINEFYKKLKKTKPRIAVLGLNPHCESVDKFNEDEKIITPIIKHLKKIGYNIKGPYPADTIFLKNNRKKFDVIVGMYHDQVLTPIKTLFEYDAINITLGLPFKRISPDHGPNEKMVGKNLSNPLSLIRAIEFLDKN
ncbi:4-hydroxythreonine-4-phosphate dehydrogenase PdxA [Candidatus Pelagibacter bacterium nBUS_30]|uniref:4-hydroxythreonine-4-phosphate dehydrogenase PdxA n=1 Tax=Candidatus Pelagibacter bacterium nBUS_30 TaxID=3374191 RepID=UPI003EBDA9DA